MMTFMLVSSMEEIRGTAPMFRLLSAAVTLPRCSDIFLFGIVGMLVEFFSFEENELNDCNKKSINLPQSYVLTLSSTRSLLFDVLNNETTKTEGIRKLQASCKFCEKIFYDGCTIDNGQFVSCVNECGNKS